MQTPFRGAVTSKLDRGIQATLVANPDHNCRRGKKTLDES
jgi:hypothetical protein